MISVTTIWRKAKNSNGKDGSKASKLWQRGFDKKILTKKKKQ